MIDLNAYLRGVFSFLLLAAAVCGLASCKDAREPAESAHSGETSVSTPAPASPPPANARQLLPDASYQNGFYIRCQDGALPEEKRMKGVFLPNFGHEPSWAIAQWTSGLCLWDSRVLDGRKISDGIAKSFTAAEGGHLRLHLNTIPLYDGAPAAYADWPHLLLETEDIAFDGSDSDSVWLTGAADKIVVSLDLRLTQFEQVSVSGDAARAAQFLCYLYLKSQPGDDFVWFGLQLFDSRGPQGEYLALDEGSGRMIFSLSTHDVYGGGQHPRVQRGAAADGEWYHVEVDIRPYLDRLAATGRKDGFLKSVRSAEDFHISGTNIGWEIIGSFDACMEIKNYSVVSYVN